MAKISVIFLIFQDSKFPVIMYTFQEQGRKKRPEGKQDNINIKNAEISQEFHQTSVYISLDRIMADFLP